MTSTQVYKYAEYLGVNLDQYPELYPLMEQGLRAPLPAGWEIISEGNSHYFLNNVTGTMQKDHPADDLYRQAARRQMNDLGPRSPAGRAGLARSPSNAFTPSRSRELDAPQPNSSSSSSTSERTERGRAIRYMCFGFLLAVLLHATIALALFHAYSSEGLPPIFSALWSPAAPSVAPQPAADAVATPAAAAAPASSAAATPTSRGAKVPVEAKEEPAEEEEEAGSWW